MRRHPKCYRPSLKPQALRVALGLMAAAMLPGALAAEPASQTVIVLDGSGSMGGPLEGQKTVKYEMAREAVRKAVSSVAPEAPLGLVVFGHRRRGNCSDVELVTPPAPATAEGIMARLDKIGTVGKGPLVLALREAAKTFAPGTPGSIIIIHDDADNCRQDPCAAASELHATKPDVAVHVVTVSLNPETAKVMSCIPRTTGGRQFEARDQASLDESVAEAFARAGVSPGAAAAAPTPAESEAAQAPPETGGPSRIKLTASLGRTGGAVARDVAWRVAAAGAPEKALIETTGPEVAAPLAAGKYIVDAGLGLASQRLELDVAEEGETAARIALEAGTLKITMAASKTGDPLDNPLVTILATDGEAAEGGTRTLWVGRTPPPELVLPAGSYLVRVADSLATKEAPVTLTAGSVVAADFIMGTGHLELSAVTTAGGAPVDGAVFMIEVDDPDSPGGRREIARSANPAPDFRLTAGTYYATARLGRAEARELVAIGTGDAVKRELALGVGLLSLSANFDPALAARGTSVNYRVFRLKENGGGEIAHSSAAAPEIYVPAGRYRVEARLGALPLRAASLVEVPAGATVKAELKIEAAELSLTSQGASGKAPIWWEVRDGRGHVVMRSSQSTLGGTAHLAPGRYTVRSERGDERREQVIELKAGDRQTVDTSLE